MPAQPISRKLETNQDILQSGAEETGGRAFLNTNDIQGAVRRAADDARMTYVLGYYPTNEIWDGRFHRVEVSEPPGTRSVDNRVDISLSGERLQLFLRDGLRIEHTVTLMPDAERLRVVVRDARTGAIGAIGVSRQQLEAIVP